ncbi:MAG: 50S ribosomal protein L24 [Candidatus Aenigmatarchaeota archaeon]|nr:MAG: 50S ribosomal protein L24 [Candidatus Aenigmarchaeota archaeon]
MKKEWSSKWKSSKQPRKQRKYRYRAPLHIRRKFVSANLSPELRKKYGKRSVPIRKGDEVVVKRGDFKGVRGKVERVDLKSCRVWIDSVKVKKADGSEVLRPIDPSNLQIVSLNLDDKKRVEVLARK